MRWGSSFVVVLVAFFAMSLSATGQTIIDWTGLGANDLYNNTDNWAGNNEPGNVNESARFNLAGTFNVEMPGLVDRTVSDLFVLDGTISFASSAFIFIHTYTVDDDAFIDTDLTIENTNGGDFAMVVNSDLSIRSDGSLTIQDSTSVSTGNLFAGRSSSGDGTVIVDGFGSVLDVSNSTILGSVGNTGTLTFQNGSTFNDLDGTITLVAGSSVGSTGRMNVLSGSTVNTASIRVGSLSTSASAVQEATLTVNGTDSRITQTGASALTIGDATNPNVDSEVVVSAGGVFNTGTGATLIQNTGALTITDGTFNANGTMTMTAGTTLTLDGGALNANAGLDNTAEGQLTFRDGTLTVTGGAYTPNSGDATDDYVVDGLTLTDLPHLVLGSGATLDVGRDLTVGFDDRGRVTVQDGASMTNEDAFIGLVGSSIGSDVTVTGDNSTWDSSGTVLVGLNGSGTMNVESEGSASSAFGVIGEVAGAVGVATVTGTDSTWQVTNDLITGNFGDGTLNIEAGGSVTSARGFIASSSGSDGDVTLTGTGSSLFHSGDLYVGGNDLSAEGTGTLTINDETVASAGGDTIIWTNGLIDISTLGAFNANGSVDVDGGTLQVGPSVVGDEFNLASGETLTATNGGVVQFDGVYDIDGNTTFMIESGASLTAADLDIANILDPGSGTLVVTGAGSSVDGSAGFSNWGNNNNTATITLSDQATGTFGGIDLANSSDPNTVANLSVRNDGSGGATLNTDSIDIASVAGSGATGTITIDGTDSTLTQTGASALEIGSTSGTGSATVDIQNGGTFTTGTGTTTINATGAVNIGLTGGGTFNANGPVQVIGGQLTVEDDFNDIFDLASGQTLTASSDAQVDFGAYNINEGTTVEINSGADLSALTLNVGASTGSGTLVVDGLGSSVTSDFAGTWATSGHTADVTFRQQATGDLNGVLMANSTAAGTTATLAIESGATVTATGIQMANFGGATTTAMVTIDGVGSSLTLTSTGSLDIGHASLGSATVNVQNDGTLILEDGIATINATGTINLSGGTLDAATIEHTDGGVFNFTGGTLHVETFDGDLTNQGGTLAPGTSPGTTDVTGSYDQQSGTLEIEIGGTGAGDFDVLDVTGSATLAGMLDVQLIDLGGGTYSPLAGDSFEILTSGTLSGTFSGGTSLPTLTGLLQWNVNYDTVGNRVLLEVSTPLSADFDGDGDVDNDDLGLWENAYASTDIGDANDDGRSDGLDFLIWQEQFGLGGASPLTASVSSVPEPSGLVLCALAAIMSFRAKQEV